MKTKILVLFAAIVMMITVSGCPGSNPDNQSTAASSSNTSTTAAAATEDTSTAEATSLSTNVVLIENHAFNPGVLTIKAGDSVTWTNKDSVAHSVVFADFKSISLKKGDSFTHVFDTAGSYQYNCGPHPDMKGTIEVQ